MRRYPPHLITAYMRISDELIREIGALDPEHPIKTTPAWGTVLQLVADTDRAVQLVGYIRATQLVEQLAPELLQAPPAPVQIH